MSFLQFYVWGAWLITIGTYCIEGKGWSFPQFGAVFSTLAISSLFMPAIVGVIADKWVNAERLYGILHLLYGLVLFLFQVLMIPMYSTIIFFWPCFFTCLLFLCLILFHSIF
jgi:NHS family xanthosine MFS transporter